MSLTMEVDGVDYTQFVRAEATIRLDVLSNTFSFQATSNNENPLPFSVDQSCKIKADGELILTGHIELINIDGNSTSRVIDIEGRDNTGDLLDSSIGSLDGIRSPISLKTLIERVITHIDADITVVDLAKPAIFSKASDIMAPEVGQSAWEFIDSYARKRQVLLSSNALGQIVITASSGKEIEATIKHIRHSNENNVLTYAARYDSTGRFNRYVFSAQRNLLALNFAGFTSNKAIVSQSGEVIDEGLSRLRTGRQMALVAETSSSSTDLKKRAQWEANIRKARGRVYSATVRGFRNQTGKLWNINELVSVEDEFVGIDSRMLSNSVMFSTTKKTADRCTISFVEKNAYTLTLEEPRTDKVGGGGFTLPLLN